jgi:hypothetical protein
MELKNVGMVKRKQFLQKREISRSHEVIKMVILHQRKKKKNSFFKKTERE